MTPKDPNALGANNPTHNCTHVAETQVDMLASRPGPELYQPTRAGLWPPTQANPTGSRKI